MKGLFRISILFGSLLSLIVVTASLGGGMGCGGGSSDNGGGGTGNSGGGLTPAQQSAATSIASFQTALESALTNIAASGGALQSSALTVTLPTTINGDDGAACGTMSFGGSCPSQTPVPISFNLQNCQVCQSGAATSFGSDTISGTFDCSTHIATVSTSQGCSGALKVGSDTIGLVNYQVSFDPTNPTQSPKTLSNASSICANGNTFDQTTFQNIVNTALTPPDTSCFGGSQKPGPVASTNPAVTNSVAALFQLMAQDLAIELKSSNNFVNGSTTQEVSDHTFYIDCQTKAISETQLSSNFMTVHYYNNTPPDAPVAQVSGCTNLKVQMGFTSCNPALKWLGQLSDLSSCTVAELAPLTKVFDSTQTQQALGVQLLGGNFAYCGSDFPLSEVILTGPVVGGGVTVFDIDIKYSGGTSVNTDASTVSIDGVTQMLSGGTTCSGATGATGATGSTGSTGGTGGKCSIKNEAFLSVASTGRCYHAIVPSGDNLTWADSETCCTNSGGNLASINSAEENASVRQVADDACGNVSLWIGLEDGDVVNSTGNTITGTEDAKAYSLRWTDDPTTIFDLNSSLYQNWSAGEPTNGTLGVNNLCLQDNKPDQPYENVTEMYPDGTWNDNCQNIPASACYVCETACP